MKRFVSAAVVAIAALIVIGSAKAQGSAPQVSSVAAPAGMESLGVEWMNISAPGVGSMRAAVARPSGAGPFPVVVVLHGSHGFAREYVQLAQALSREGVIAMAACWFSGGGGAGARFITPIACPDAPPSGPAATPVAMQTVDALVQAASALPGARADRVGLFGHSRGGGAAWNYILGAGASRVRAAVLCSAGYPREVNDRAADFKAAVLILHGSADSPADGGSEFTNVQMARNFEAALRRGGKPVEAHYYDGGEHNGLFTSATQFEDEVRRAATFLQRHLRD